MKFCRLLVGGALAACAAVVAGFCILEQRAERSLTWPEPLRDAEARTLLRSECEAAAREGRPLLIEFSAPWCEHCQAVKKTLVESDLSSLLARFRTVVLNIGDDAELNDLRRELEARAIPAWVVVEPERCEVEPQRWKRLANTYPRGNEGALKQFLAPLGG